MSVTKAGIFFLALFTQQAWGSKVKASPTLSAAASDPLWWTHKDVNATYQFFETKLGEQLGPFLTLAAACSKCATRCPPETALLQVARRGEDNPQYDKHGKVVSTDSGIWVPPIPPPPPPPDKQSCTCTTYPKWASTPEFMMFCNTPGAPQRGLDETPLSTCSCIYKDMEQQGKDVCCAGNTR
eukprot:CAMPEP_0197656696 /NCGR_PEP_ID=MMETSP1338-20131121/42942_1 /TAXON_ID=43686 ORGANISM="Pelagodinium beii, Strain RCC1491" /NCGR_SAMPLE_ID=MMETSP1338 /ASSEMBLY_ACC=CAM_ASM_000754 /LENGTH=182 /DNA_ID=CAMNT_0043232819 /DNA_START=36 /DNA_END=584 /DNA_ORIENTATION=+